MTMIGMVTPNKLFFPRLHLVMVFVAAAEAKTVVKQMQQVSVFSVSLLFLRVVLVLSRNLAAVLAMHLEHRSGG